MSGSNDFKCYDVADLDYDKLDPNVREVVRWLASMGFNTSDSGDGKYKLEQGWTAEEIVPFPHVYMTVDKWDLVSETKRLQFLLKRDFGIELVQAWTEEGKPHIEVLWDPTLADGVIGLYNVTNEMLLAAPSVGPV